MLSPKEQLVWCQEHYVNARSLQKATDVLKQLHQQFVTLKLPMATAGTEVEPVLKALVAGLFTNAAKRQADGMSQTGHRLSTSSSDDQLIAALHNFIHSLLQCITDMENVDQGTCVCS